MRVPFVVLLVAVVATLVGCGRSTLLRAPDGSGRPDLRPYDTLVIENLTDATREQFANPGDEQRYRERVQRAGTHFAERIADEVRFRKIFRNVTREPASDTAGRTLVLDGRILIYDRGNAAWRFLVGFRAGSAFFDAELRLRDAATGATLALVAVDKDSWLLGGLGAALQTPEVLINESARGLARELGRARGIRAAPGDVIAARHTGCGRGERGCRN